MNFVQQLEECFRDLASEARKNHPGVKEASERATLKLRSLKSVYVSAVRKASKTNSNKHRGLGGDTGEDDDDDQHPTCKLFQSSDLLHPFLLAANYPTASPAMLDISFSAFRLLMEADAVVPEDGIHMVRVWMIQAQVVISYYRIFYAKEIKAAELVLSAEQQRQQEEQQQQGGSSESTRTASTSKPKSTPSSTGSNYTARPEPAGSNTGWFSGWGSSSATAAVAKFKQPEQVKNAGVSSSAGNTGTANQSPEKMEKLALEILSSLLQLLELLTSNYAENCTSELWASAVALSCLWLHYLPARHTVLQAARSTLSQVLSLVFHPGAANRERSDNDADQRTLTWQDLLTLATLRSSSTGGGAANNENAASFQGAFSLCKTLKANGSTQGRRGTNSSTTPSIPPTPEFALELMVRLWKENLNVNQMSPAMLVATMSATSKLLEQNPTASLEKALRTTQWTTAVIQTTAVPYPSECRNFFFKLIKQITTATEACRRSDDFEDGYVYSRDEAIDQKHAEYFLHHPSSVTSMDEGRAGNGSSSSSNAKDTGGERLQTFFPTTILWKAALALEAVHSLLVLRNGGDELSSSPGNADLVSILLFQDPQVAAVTAEALSDFAAVSASCRDHILQLVNLILANQHGDDDDNVVSRIKPAVFRLAEQTIQSRARLNKNTSHYYDSSKSKSSAAAERSSLIKSPLGEALWIAFGSILQIIKAVGKVPQEQHNNNIDTQNSSSNCCIIRQSLLDEIFAPVLAVLQHYMKRVVGSDCLVQLALSGYACLAESCLENNANNNGAGIQQQNTQHGVQQQLLLQRQALLTSLSKLSLPAWGQQQSSSSSTGQQLQDHHVAALKTLAFIVHKHYDSISGNWDMILWTFEELSNSKISSPLQSSAAYHTALAVSALYSRFAPLSTCFSVNSLEEFVSALKEICKVSMENRDVVMGDVEMVLPDRNTTNPTGITAGNLVPESSMPSSEGSTGQETISEKIMSIGVRAIYGSQNEGDADNSGAVKEVILTERTKSSYYEDYLRDFTKRVSASKTSALRTGSVGRLPFCLVTLADTVWANSFRYELAGKEMSNMLFEVAAASPAVRPFTMDVISVVISSHLALNERDFPAPFVGPGKIVFGNNPMQSQLWAVERVKGEQQQEENDYRARNVEAVSQAELLAPLCDMIRRTEKADFAETALRALLSVLDSTGHKLHGNDVWSCIIYAVTSLSGDPSYLPVNRSAPEWSKCCLEAFRCLKFIVDNFLDQLPAASTDNSSSEITARTSLLDCCSSFASSLHDVNTSLTAIGLLWTIADQDANWYSIDRALAKLAELCSDNRAEIRNAAVNTLFSCIVGRGSGFSATQWCQCLAETVFGVYDLVSSRTAGSGEGADGKQGRAQAQPSELSSPRYKVPMHHSRDSASKQWGATQVLVLQGLIRVLRNFCTQLLDTIDVVDINEGKENVTNIFSDEDDEVPWFQDAWVRILDFAFEAAHQAGGRDTLAVRSVGVELLVVCCQLASVSGIQATLTPARVGTNMEVVNGALRSVREAASSKAVPSRRSLSVATEQARQLLFLEAFESLESYQEFLEKTSNTEEALSDDSRLQVLHKFGFELGKLYECCKDKEFLIDNRSRSLQSFAWQKPKSNDSEKDDNELESRFLAIVVSVMEESSGGGSSRFLNQAQRCSLDLLKLIASDGSSEAFMQLVCFASGAFYGRSESEADESESGDTEEAPSFDLVHFEAASAISEAISKDKLSDECRALVLYKILVIFSTNYDEIGGSENKKTCRHKQDYKRLVPIVLQGLGAASRLDTKEDTDEKYAHAVDLLWKQMLNSMSDMLTPVLLGKGLMKISRVTELQEIITVTLASAPDRFVPDLCAVLSSGALKMIEVAKLHEKITNANSKGDSVQKSKRHREDVLKLFTICFTGICLHRPEDPVLRSIAKQSLSGAVETMNNASGISTPGDASNVDAEVTIRVCQAMKSNEKTESLVISVFPLLCKLVASNDSNVSLAANEVFSAVDIAHVLQAGQKRFEEAEKRALEAERKVAELQIVVEELKQKNQELQRGTG